MTKIDFDVDSKDLRDVNFCTNEHDFLFTPELVKLREDIADGIRKLSMLKISLKSIEDKRREFVDMPKFVKDQADVKSAIVLLNYKIKMLKLNFFEILNKRNNVVSDSDEQNIQGENQTDKIVKAIQDISDHMFDIQNKIKILEEALCIGLSDFDFRLLVQAKEILTKRYNDALSDQNAIRKILVSKRVDDIMLELGLVKN